MSVACLPRFTQSTAFPTRYLDKLENFLESRISRDFVWEMTQMAKEQGYLTESTEIKEKRLFPALGDSYWDPVLYEYKDQPAPIYWCLSNGYIDASLLVVQLEDPRSLKHWTACFLYYEDDGEANAKVLSTPFSFVPPEEMVENFKKLLNRETVVIKTPPKELSRGWQDEIHLRLRDLRN